MTMATTTFDLENLIATAESEVKAQSIALANRLQEEKRQQNEQALAQFKENLIAVIGDDLVTGLGLVFSVEPESSHDRPQASFEFEGQTIYFVYAGNTRIIDAVCWVEGQSKRVTFYGDTDRDKTRRQFYTMLGDIRRELQANKELTREEEEPVPEAPKEPQGPWVVKDCGASKLQKTLNQFWSEGAEVTNIFHDAADAWFIVIAKARDIS